MFKWVGSGPISINDPTPFIAVSWTLEISTIAHPPLGGKVKGRTENDWSSQSEQFDLFCKETWVYWVGEKKMAVQEYIEVKRVENENAEIKDDKMSFRWNELTRSNEETLSSKELLVNFSPHTVPLREAVELPYYALAFIEMRTNRATETWKHAAALTDLDKK